MSVAISNKKYYEKNREHIRAKVKAQYAINPEPTKAALKRYYEKNKERTKARTKAWRIANPDKLKAQRLKPYGLTLERFNSLLEQQGFACAVCRKKQAGTLYVDHNHTTNQVRGLLCQNCNAAIGHIYDDPNIGLALSNYLDWYENLPASLL